jgi:hypothetical protein
MLCPVPHDHDHHRQVNFLRVQRTSSSIDRSTANRGGTAVCSAFSDVPSGSLEYAPWANYKNMSSNNAAT